MATGAGKTWFALYAAASLMENYADRIQIRIVVPTCALASQWKKEILRIFPNLDIHDIGMWQGELKQDPDRLFMIYVINSARYTISRHMIQNMKRGIHQFLICDECHRYTGESNRLIFSFLNHPDFDERMYHSLGMSATPYHSNFNEVLVPSLGDLIYTYDTKQAAEDGTVSPFSLIQVSVELSPEELRNYASLDQRIRKLYHELRKAYPEISVMNVEQLFHFLSSMETEDPEGMEALFCQFVRMRKKIVLLAENRVRCAVELVKRLKPEEQVILFCERISQAEFLYSRIKAEVTTRVGHYHSELSDEMKKYYLERMRSGDDRILVTCRALDEGLNVPEVSAGIVVSSSSSTRQRIQRLGRILRHGTNKNAVLYYLHTGAMVDTPYYLLDTLSETETISMKYHSLDNTFDCPIYEDVAYHMLEQHSFDPQLRTEVIRCIEEGLTRADWRLGSNCYTTRIQSAKTKSEQNYWLVMKWMSETASRPYAIRQEHQDEMKLPGSGLVDASQLSDVEMDAELDKEYEDMKAGRTKSVESVFTDIRKDYDL